MAETYPDFAGWTVEHREARNELRATKPHPDAPGGRMVVRVMGANLDRVYLTLKQDALAEEHRLEQTAESEAAATDAARALVIDKVKEGLAKGFGEEYAINRLRAAGCSVEDVMGVLGEGSD